MDSYQRPYVSEVQKHNNNLKVIIFKNKTRIATITLNIQTYEVTGKLTSKNTQDFEVIWKKLRYFFDNHRIKYSKNKSIEFKGIVNGLLEIEMDKSFHKKLIDEGILLI